ncbi:response regulator [Anaerocolumna sedimenticola]|uniref:Stage 0 sporulation protein A homolog n=1 Tax=Anaerocolumna sedimenticola TaxID=2696063 RepID=A0A6P1TLS3_9FIRM|nr:response regulator [Anaerocolumna sedimenticola]QHQ61237.1 response regulator [Anaerocolumna sedimenticola]
MYKAIIVDDEKMIRMGMRKAIPWNTLGIEEVYVAKSGKEAMEMIEENKPEIMITDINMDEMSGLDLIDRVKKLLPDIRILVLTGYDKFEYARQCIKLKVHDFFLKPIDETQLIEAVKKQVAYLNEKKAEKVVNFNINRAQAVAEQMNIERFLRCLVHRRVQNLEEQITVFCNKYKYIYTQPMQAAILVPTLYMDNGKYEENFIALSVKNICIGMVDALNRGLTFIDDYERIVIAFFLDKQKGSILEWIQELNDILSDEYNKKPKVVVGNPVIGFEHLYISYNDAVSLLKYEKDDLGEIIQTQYAKNRDNLYREVFVEMKNAMCVNIGDSDKVLYIFNRFRQATDSYNLSDSYIRKSCFELASSIYYTFICNTGEEADSRLSILLKSLMNVKGNELFELSRQFFIKLLANKEDQNVHEIIDKAKHYIKENLADELSVSNIAAVLYISPNYFSRLFKKVTGEGCNEYIVRKRIEKAKLLLETTNFKASKIAMMVGYRDTNYFSLAVKKNTGMSPTKYREEFQKV